MCRAVRTNIDQLLQQNTHDALTRGLDISHLHDPLRTCVLQAVRNPNSLRYTRFLFQMRYPRAVKIHADVRQLLHERYRGCKKACEVKSFRNGCWLPEGHFERCPRIAHVIRVGQSATPHEQLEVSKQLPVLPECNDMT